MHPVHVIPLPLIALILLMQSANHEASQVFFSRLPLRCKYFSERHFVLLLWRSNLTPVGNKVLCFKEVIYFLDKERGDKIL
jgi:hypothetical protein